MFLAESVAMLKNPSKFALTVARYCLQDTLKGKTVLSQKENDHDNYK